MKHAVPTTIVNAYERTSPLCSERKTKPSPPAAFATSSTPASITCGSTVRAKKAPRRCAGRTMPAAMASSNQKARASACGSPSASARSRSIEPRSAYGAP